MPSLSSARFINISDQADNNRISFLFRFSTQTALILSHSHSHSHSQSHSHIPIRHLCCTYIGIPLYSRFPFSLPPRSSPLLCSSSPSGLASMLTFTSQKIRPDLLKPLPSAAPSESFIDFVLCQPIVSLGSLTFNHSLTRLYWPGTGAGNMERQKMSKCSSSINDHLISLVANCHLKSNHKLQLQPLVFLRLFALGIAST